MITVRELIDLLGELPQDLQVQTCRVERSLDYFVETNIDTAQTVVEAQQRGPRIFTVEIDLDSWRLGTHSGGIAEKGDYGLIGKAVISEKGLP